MSDFMKTLSAGLVALLAQRHMDGRKDGRTEQHGNVNRWVLETVRRMV